MKSQSLKVLRWSQWKKKEKKKSNMIRKRKRNNWRLKAWELSQRSQLSRLRAIRQIV
jgi:hypothetical protein